MPRSTRRPPRSVTLDLRPMTTAERDRILEAQAVEYADAKARAGIWPREESLARAREEIAALVGTDPAARGHEFFFGIDGRGERVGWAWFGPVPDAAPAPDARWLFQIEVDAPRRGRGYGRALLEAVERHLVRAGWHELRLNVFRWNTVAVGLYSRSGYEVAEDGERSLEMRKRLLRR